jgi:glutamate racemase
MIVTKAFLSKNPGRDVLCFGDNLHFYPEIAGNPDEMIRSAVKDISFLTRSGAKLILIASHTLSCIAGTAMAECTPVPVLDIIAPSVRRAVLRTRYGRIGIIGSRPVTESRIYPDKITENLSGAKVYSAATPLLLSLIQEGWLKKPVTAMIIKKYLIPLKTRQIDTLVLAGAPYALLSTVIQRKIGKQVQLIDGADALAETAVEHLNAHPVVSAQIGHTGWLQVMVTRPSPFLEKQARDILNVRSTETAIP